jgi:hypothetical protein
VEAEERWWWCVLGRSVKMTGSSWIFWLKQLPHTANSHSGHLYRFRTNAMKLALMMVVVVVHTRFH